MLSPVRSPDVIADRFDVVRHAGSGGMGDVYQATDRRSGQIVAVKILRSDADADSVERFALESRVLARLSHPDIVRHIAHGRAGDHVFLAMEWLEGLTLSQRLARKGLTIEESVALIRRVAEALGVAHGQGIVHRDIKPGNIFLVDGEVTQVKLLDFGIARLQSSAVELTRTGILLGTPAYMAPEQARGEKALDARADVFSLGGILFRCLTGTTPFSGDDVMAVLVKIVVEEAPLVSALRPDVPPSLEQLVARMLAKRPDDRPADANAVAAAIDALGPLGGGDAPAAKEAPAPAITTDERRIMCVLLARAPIDDEGAPAGIEDHVDTLRDAIIAHGGELDVLADRSILVTVPGKGTPADHAARAARCALAMRALLPSLSIVLVAGEGVLKGGVPIGPVIDRGASLLATVPARGPARLDELVAGFLDARFHVQTDEDTITLLGERDAPGAARTLLGRPSTCVGRERDLATLATLWEECVEEPAARIVLVTGPAGVGKSRVVDEFLRNVGGHEPSFEVWTGRGDPMSAGSPFGMIADPIRSAAGIHTGEPHAERQAKLLARVGSVVPPSDAQRVAEFLAEIIGVPFPEGESAPLRAARRDALLMGDQMRRAWEDWVHAESSRRPILLVLEDLHWGDLPSVTFVDAAARHLGGHPFLVIALARPEVHSLFPGLWADRNLTEIRLGRLAKKAAARLVREGLGAAVDDTIVERVVERADGNAFFLEEIVRAIAEGKGDELPSTVLAMVQARLEGLPVEARRLLRAASIFGESFSSAGVAALLGEGATSRHDWLSELVAKEIIKRPAQARFQGELAFHHALIHEAAYSMLTEQDRALGHRLAAEWLSKAGEPDAVVLAEHFERGGEPLRAIEWYRRAAEQALEGNDLASAIQRVNKAIACGAGGEEEGRLRLVESAAERWRGENELAKNAAIRAMRALPRGSPSWCEAASELATVCGSLGATAQLVALVTELDDVQPEGSPSHLVDALARLARPLFWAGKHGLAGRVLARADLIAEAAPDVQPTALAAFYMARGVEARVLGDPNECVRWNERAVAQSELVGDRRIGCVQRGNLGYAYLEIGAHAEAERTLTEALATATRLGLPLVVATAQQNLGLVLGRRGAFDDALRLERASIAAFEAQSDFRRCGASLMYLALIEIARGTLEDAEISARRAVQIAARMEPLRCNALGVLARIELARGQVERAVATAGEAHALLTKLVRIDEGESLVRLVHTEALHASGQVEPARAALAVALDRLHARAARIQDDARRAGFLEAIPDNARTVELARAWGIPR
jgi:eukaryotic-like serine/threonine-protein kinase